MLAPPTWQLLQDQAHVLSHLMINDRWCWISTSTSAFPGGPPEVRTLCKPLPLCLPPRTACPVKERKQVLATAKLVLQAPV